MTYLLEESLWVVVVGIALGFGGVVVWLNTGKRWCLYVVATCAALTAGLVALEQLIETDREQLSDTLHAIAHDVQRDDLDAILSWIDPAATAVREEARNEFPRYVFDHVDIKQNLEVEVTPGEARQAETRFNVVIVISEREGLLQNRRIPLFVTVKFREVEGAWKVTSYDYEDPRTGFRRRDRSGVRLPRSLLRP